MCTPNISQPCYDGPPGTQMTAPCKPGVQICAADGMSWGPCLTQVTPIVEDCGTAADDDCNGAANDHCATWAKCFGDSSPQKPWALAVSPSGRVVVAGELYGGPDFGGGALATAGGGDAFVAVFDSAGTHVWSRTFGDASTQAAYGVAVDSAGNVVITGVFEGTLNFGGGITLTSAGLTDIFIAKLDAAGAALWARRFGSAASDEQGNGVALDASGNVLVAAEFDGTVDFGAGPKSAQGTNGAILKLSPAGDVLWSYTFGSSSADSAASVTADASGNVIVTGTFSSSAVFGATTLTSAGQTDVLVAKLSSAGVPVWARAFGSKEVDYAGSAAVDLNGNVITAGFFGNVIDFGCGSIAAVGPTDLFVVKLSAAGQCSWSKGFGDPTDGSEAARVAVDGAGNVYVVDEFVGTADYGGGPISVPTPHDVLLLSFDPAGNHRYTRRFGDGLDQDGRGIGVDSAGNVYLTAELSGGKIDFGKGPISTKGSDDVCVARISP